MAKRTTQNAGYVCEIFNGLQEVLNMRLGMPSSIEAMEWDERKDPEARVTVAFRFKSIPDFSDGVVILWVTADVRAELASQRLELVVELYSITLDGYTFRGERYRDFMEASWGDRPRADGYCGGSFSAVTKKKIARIAAFMAAK